MFLAAKEVLNIIAGLGSFAKEFLKEAGGEAKYFHILKMLRMEREKATNNEKKQKINEASL